MSISKITQNLGEMDEVTLQNVTERAYALQDVFDMGVDESARAAKAMAENFGVSAADAYDYIAKGAQDGLDYSGELLDSISEYSVQFAKLGFSADDMFNIFAQGAENGAWNLDKVGDAINFVYHVKPSFLEPGARTCVLDRSLFFFLIDMTRRLQVGFAVEDIAFLRKFVSGSLF